MRENCTYGSEGGEAKKPSLPPSNSERIARGAVRILRQPHAPPSSPAKAGDPVFQRRPGLNREFAAYWIPAFAGTSASARTFCWNGASPLWSWSQLHNRR